MTIADSLSIIRSSLQNIKTSIINQGQTLTGDITTYADAIDAISTHWDIKNIMENAEDVTVGDYLSTSSFVVYFYNQETTSYFPIPTTNIIRVETSDGSIYDYGSDEVTNATTDYGLAHTWNTDYDEKMNSSGLAGRYVIFYVVDQADISDFLTTFSPEPIKIASNCVLTDTSYYYESANDNLKELYLTNFAANVSTGEEFNNFFNNFTNLEILELIYHEDSSSLDLSNHIADWSFLSTGSGIKQLNLTIPTCAAASTVNIGSKDNPLNLTLSSIRYIADNAPKSYASNLTIYLVDYGYTASGEYTGVIANSGIDDSIDTLSSKGWVVLIVGNEM